MAVPWECVVETEQIWRFDPAERVPDDRQLQRSYTPGLYEVSVTPCRAWEDRADAMVTLLGAGGRITVSARELCAGGSGWSRVLPDDEDQLPTAAFDRTRMGIGGGQ